MTDNTEYLDPDKNVTETFLHKDPRSENRRIKILGIVGNHPDRGPIYAYRTLTNEGNPNSVGRRGRLSRKILDREWERVSK